MPRPREKNRADEIRTDRPKNPPKSTEFDGNRSLDKKGTLSFNINRLRNYLKISQRSWNGLKTFPEN